jgi:hypothetical protein
MCILKDLSKNFAALKQAVRAAEREVLCWTSKWNFEFVCVCVYSATRFASVSVRPSVRPSDDRLFTSHSALYGQSAFRSEISHEIRIRNEFSFIDCMFYSFFVFIFSSFVPLSFYFYRTFIFPVSCIPVLACYLSHSLKRNLPTNPPHPPPPPLK